MTKAIAFLTAFLGCMSLGLAQQPAVLNQDGSINSSANRAARGETVQLFLTEPAPRKAEAPKDGPETRENHKPCVFMNVRPVEVVSSGVAPEFPGVWKITARVPTPDDGEEPLHDHTPYVVYFDGIPGNLGTLWVEP